MPLDAIPLMKAASTLKLGYHTALTAVLRGELEGWQDDGRRWWVDSVDLARYIGERESRTQQQTSRRSHARS